MDWTSIGTNAITGGLSSLGSSLFGGIFGSIGAKQQFKQQQKLLAQQNQYNIDAFNRENEYNSPSAQMQRLQDAGLNPNLIYGNGGTNFSSADINPQQVPNAPRNFMQFMGDNMQNTLSSAETLSRIGKTESETTGQNLHNTYAGQLYEGQLSMFASTSALNAAQTGNQLFYLQTSAALYNTTIEEAKQRLELIKKNVNISDKECLLLDWKITQTIQDIFESQSRINLNKEEANLKQNSIQLGNAKIRNLGYQNQLLKWQSQELKDKHDSNYWSTYSSNISANTDTTYKLGTYYDALTFNIDLRSSYQSTLNKMAKLDYNEKLVLYKTF